MSNNLIAQIEGLIINWLWGGSSNFTAWLAEKAEIFEGWKVSHFFADLLGSLPLILAFLFALASFAFVGLLFWFAGHLFSGGSSASDFADEVSEGRRSRRGRRRR